MDRFAEEVVDILEDVVDLSREQIEGLIETPPSPNLGDYAFSCFVLAKRLKKPPAVIAEQLSRKLEPKGYISQIKNLGPYVNFSLDKEKLTVLVLREIFTKGHSYGDWDVGDGKTVVVDFSSPNIAKPFGIGHLRSTIIGWSLCKLYESLGYRCIGVNHLGDWGTQFGELITAYKKWGLPRKTSPTRHGSGRAGLFRGQADKKEQLGDEPIQRLYELYVRFHTQAQRGELLKDEARDWFRRLEAGDQEATQLWSWFKDISLREFQRIYDVLGIGFDSYAGESFYNPMLTDTIEELKAAGLVQESQGALIVNLDRYDMPPCLLRKSDGSTLYATRDIAAAQYRFENYHFDKMIYVVGAEQKLHFQQVFKVLELLGYEWADTLVHVPFGLIKFNEGKMSTRKGNVIFLEEVFQKAIDLTQEIIEEKNPGLEGKEEIAQQVGVGAIIFADLSNKRMKDIDFDWDRMLNFNGETGPYVQYTHARFSSVIRKYGKEVSDYVDFSLLNKDVEMDVVRLLARFPEVIKRGADEYEPSVVANYLLGLCSAANRFYNSSRVLAKDEQKTRARVLLVWCIRIVLEKGLGLLGMKAPQRM